MPEQKTDLGFKDYLDLPNGREEFAKHMLGFHKSESTEDTRFTDDENLGLYRLYFDRAILKRQFENKQISGFELDAQNDAINGKVKAILETSYKHRHSEP